MYLTAGCKSVGRSWIFHAWCVLFLWNGPLHWLHCQSFPVEQRRWFNGVGNSVCLSRFRYLQVVKSKIFSAFFKSHKCKFKVSVSIVKPYRCAVFEFIEYHSTYFGRYFRPSSGVQDFQHSIRYMSYRLVNCLLASSQLTCMTYTWCCV